MATKPLGSACRGPGAPLARTPPPILASSYVELLQQSEAFALNRVVWGSTEDLPLVCARLFRLFFPLTLLEASRGWLVGWGLRDGAAVACGLLPPMPPRLVGAFLAQLNSRLLRPTSSRARVSSSDNSSSSSIGDFADELVFDYRVLPQAIELLGWWRGSEPDQACPYEETEVLQQVLQQMMQAAASSNSGEANQHKDYQKHQQKYHNYVNTRKQHATKIRSERRRGVWLDLRLDQQSGLPVPLRIASYAESAAPGGEAPAGPAAAATAAVSGLNGAGADAVAGEQPAAQATATAAAAPASLGSPRCLVFLFNLPSWVRCSTLAAAPHDVAQASAAAAFVQGPEAARALLREASQSQSFGGVCSHQQQLEQQQQRSSSSEQLCGFAAALSLLNVSAAVYDSTRQQLECWRELQLQQKAATAAHKRKNSAAGGAARSSCSDSSSSSQCCRLQQQRRGASMLRRWLSLGVSCLIRFFCCVFFSLISFVGQLSLAIVRLPLWRPCAVAHGMWCLVASVQQMVLRLQTLAAWPEALSSSRRFAAALRAARCSEKQQQQQQVAAAAAAGTLQLAAADVPALLPAQPPLKRAYLPEAFSLSAICLYGGIVAVLVDLLLGLFLPQLLALLVYHVMPPDACSSFSLYPLQQPGVPEPPLPPLYPVSLSETDPPRMYPEPQQQQHHGDPLVLLQQQYVEQQQRRHEIHQQLQELWVQPPGGSFDRAVGGGVRNEGRKRDNAAAAAEAAVAAKASAAAVAASHPNWRELMVQPTSSVLVDLFSACYCFLHVHLLTSHVHWLMDFPAGLKLNVNLTHVLGSVILTAIHLWNDLTSYLHSAIIYAEQIKWGVYDKPGELDTLDPSKPRGVLSGLMLLSSLKAAAANGIKRLYDLLSPSQAPPATSDKSSDQTDSAPSKSSDCNPSSRSSSSGGNTGGVRATWAQFASRLLWLWDTCRLCLKAGLGTLLTTFRLGWLGLSASMFVAASADLLMIVTLHIFYVYLVCARLLHVNLKSLHSLFLLFRGQKWNVLRRRVDSADLQVDQLLIGCILFTITSLLRLALLLFFSFPTCLIAFRAYFPYLFAAGVAVEPIYSLTPAPTHSNPITSGILRVLQGCRLRWGKDASRSAAAAATNSSTKRNAAAAAPAAAGKHKQRREFAVPAAAGSSSSIYFMLYARPISFGEIILPPLRAAARATLAPLRPSALFPNILRGKIVRLSRYNSAWPYPGPSPS